MPLFNLELPICDEYKIIINKYIEILSIALIYIILMDSDGRPNLADQAIYIALGVSFYYLVVKKIIKIS